MRDGRVHIVPADDPSVGNDGLRVQRSQRLDDRWFGRLLVAPAIAFTVVLIAVPLVIAIWTAFVEYNLRSVGHPFVGLENFRAVLGDAVFRRALIFTFVFAAGVTTIELVIALLLSLSLYGRSPWVRRLVLPIMIVPIFVPGVAVGQIWRLFVSRSFGPMNHLLSKLPGITIDNDWLIERPLNVVTLIAADVWQWTPLPLLLILAALEGMDRTLLEAANMDGANSWKRTFHIILPTVAPAIAAAGFFRFVDALRTYETILILTSGGPGRSTSTVSFYLLENGFGSSFNLAIASAASWIFVIVVSVVLYRVLKRRFAS